MLRLACCGVTEQGIPVCAPVHDALLVEALIEDIDATVVGAERVMADASRIVLDGFEIRAEAKVVRYPDRYGDPRGRKMWDTVMEILDGLDTSTRE